MFTFSPGQISTDTTLRLVRHISASSSIACIFGAILGVISFNSEIQFEKRLAAIRPELVTHLRADAEFLNAVINLLPYRKIDSSQSRALFDKMCMICDAIVHCEQKSATESDVSTDASYAASFPIRVAGFGINRYNRRLREASQAFERLCKRRMQTGDVTDEGQIRLLAEYASAAEPMLTIADNYVNNAMLIY